MPAQSDIEHLLRRTEFVARPERVAQLVPLSLGAAVDDVLAVGAPRRVSNVQPGDWERMHEYTYFWFDQMAHDSARPMQEKMALFWHGHLCTSYAKAHYYDPIREQIDTFRESGLGNFRTLLKAVSTQRAMLRYLDNDQNFKDSPNQNFGRELLELFTMGAGNYTEADVLASTRAWTGHTQNVATQTYTWRADLHDAGAKSFLGRTINSGADWTQHGGDIVDVVLGPGTVPVGPNAGRASRQVAAEFLSLKLWRFFAGTEPSATVLAALRDVAVANDFAMRPWLRALLTRPEFYSTEVRQGLVRSPIDLMVAYMYATGRRATGILPLWWMEGMGQKPLFPPDVSGWKRNEYFVNSAALGYRALAARFFMWNCMLGFWSGDGLLHLGGGTISRAECEALDGAPDQFVDLLLARMRVQPTPHSREVLYEHARASRWWERVSMVMLVLLLPEMNVA